MVTGQSVLENPSVQTPFSGDSRLHQFTVNLMILWVCQCKKALTSDSMILSSKIVNLSIYYLQVLGTIYFPMHVKGSALSDSCTLKSWMWPHSLHLRISVTETPTSSFLYSLSSVTLICRPVSKRFALKYEKCWNLACHYFHSSGLYSYLYV